MRAMGRYLAAISRAGRDRVIAGQGWVIEEINGCDPETIRALLDNPASVGAAS